MNHFLPKNGWEFVPILILIKELGSLAAKPSPEGEVLLLPGGPPVTNNTIPNGGPLSALSSCHRFPQIPQSDKYEKWFYEKAYNLTTTKRIEIVWSGGFEAPESKVKPKPEPLLEEKPPKGYSRHCGIVESSSPSITTQQTLISPLICEFKTKAPYNVKCETRRTKNHVVVEDTLSFIMDYNVSMTDAKTFILLVGCINHDQEHFLVMWMKDRTDFTRRRKDEIGKYLTALHMSPNKMAEDPVSLVLKSVTYYPKCDVDDTGGGWVTQQPIPNKVLTTVKLDKSPIVGIVK